LIATDISANCTITTSTPPGTTSPVTVPVTVGGTGDLTGSIPQSAGNLTINPPAVIPDTTKPNININDPYSCGSDIYGSVTDSGSTLAINANVTVRVTLTRYNTDGTAPNTTIGDPNYVAPTYIYNVNVDASGNYNLGVQFEDPTNTATYVAPGSYLIEYLAKDKANNETTGTPYTAIFKTQIDCQGGAIITPVSPNPGSTPSHPITGVIGDPFPVIRNIGGSYNGPAVFIPEGCTSNTSGSVVNGTILNGVFTPSTGSIIPECSKTATATGVLKSSDGRTQANIATNFAPKPTPKPTNTVRTGGFTSTEFLSLVMYLSFMVVAASAAGLVVVRRR
jgi:hypothetical protein